MEGGMEKNKRKTSDESKNIEPISSPTSPQSIRRDSSSSTSTELCDDPQLSDSEDKTSSLNECSVVLDPVCGGTSSSKARERNILNTGTVSDTCAVDPDKDSSLDPDKDSSQEHSEGVIEDYTLKKNEDTIPGSMATELSNFKIDPEEIKQLDRKLSLKIEEIEREKRRKSFNNLENQELIDSMVLFPFDRDYIRDNEVILEDSTEDIKEKELFFSDNKDIKYVSFSSCWSNDNALQNKDMAVSSVNLEHSCKVNVDSCELTPGSSDTAQSSKIEDIINYDWCKINLTHTQAENEKIESSESKSESQKSEYGSKSESNLYKQSDHLQSVNIFHKFYDKDEDLGKDQDVVQSTSNKNLQTLESKFLSNKNISTELQNFQKQDEDTTGTFTMKNQRISHSFADEAGLAEKKTKSARRRGSEVALSLILEENSQILSKFHKKNRKISTGTNYCDKWLESSKDISVDKMSLIEQHKLDTSFIESTTERITSPDDEHTDEKGCSSVRLSTKLFKDNIPGTSKTDDVTDIGKKINYNTLSKLKDSKSFVKDNVDNTLFHNFEIANNTKRSETIHSEESSQNFMEDRSPVNVPTAKQYSNLFLKDDDKHEITNYTFPIESSVKNDSHEIMFSDQDVKDEFSFYENRLSDSSPVAFLAETDSKSHQPVTDSKINNANKPLVSRDYSVQDNTGTSQFCTTNTDDDVTRFLKFTSQEESHFSKKLLTETTPEHFNKGPKHIFNEIDFKKNSYDLKFSTDMQSIIPKAQSEKSNLENVCDTDDSYVLYRLKYSTEKTDYVSTLKEPTYSCEHKLDASFSSSDQDDDDTKTCVSSLTFDRTLVRSEVQDRLKSDSGLRRTSDSLYRNSVSNDADVSCTSTSQTVFNPFPLKLSTRPPKELGVKLGLYLPSKTCKSPRKNNT